MITLLRPRLRVAALLLAALAFAPSSAPAQTAPIRVAIVGLRLTATSGASCTTFPPAP